MRSFLRVECTQSNCAYYERRANDNINVYCTHKDKAHYMTESSCPLYRADWNKSQDKAVELRKRFGIKR